MDINEETSDLTYASDEELFDSDSVPCTRILADELRELEDEIRVIRQLKTSLAGVPPPPFVTMPQQTVVGILDLWNSFTEGITTPEPILQKEGWRSSSTSNSFQDVLHYEWPYIKNCNFFGVNYNRSESSEKLSDLYDKWRERFVGCETSSFVTANSPSKYSINHKKNKNRSGMISPGKRLSYLTKRRSVFSAASLQAIGKSKTAGLEKKVIYLESKVKKRRLDFLQECTNTLSNCSRFSGALFKCEPNMLSTKSNALRKTPKKKTPKKSTPRKRNTPRKVTPRKQKTPNKFVSNLFLTSGSSHREAECNNNSEDLPSTHKRKLLWAVSAALKDVGISTDHKLFRSYGRGLYKVCRNHWQANNCLSIEGSTTEIMCSIARKYVRQVVDSTPNPDIDALSQDSNDSFFSKC